MAATVKADVTLTGGGDRDPFFSGQAWRHNEWSVTLRYKGRRMTLDFYTGDALGEPSARDVLECVVSDASVELAGSFEEWAADLGFDPDSRKAERLYDACVKQTKKLRRLLGDDFDAIVNPADGDQERAVRSVTDA